MVKLKAKQDVIVSGKDANGIFFRYKLDKDEIIEPSEAQVNVLINTEKFEEIKEKKSKE